ncbi:MAG: 5'-methylthioadenosine/S-adenosylhomocysteine nucleosidase [Anaerolineae bacterium]|nr:5'-methylthioadenosine/S-adenosylhomocysteine nucleosidase [Anaerolineae bacterium]
MYKVNFAVIISANIEWQAIRTLFTHIQPQPSPLGEWFVVNQTIAGRIEPVIFFHGGWGKIAAAASTQYVIDYWAPKLLVNLGTCGGFEGEITPGTIILAERTLVYDIIEQMGDYDEHIAHYTTELDLSWLGEDYPHPVQRTLLVSADRDLLAEDIPRLRAEFGAVAGDWESGAIAWVAAHNGTRCLILRGVSDLIGASGGEAYDGNIDVFVEGARRILGYLVAALPAWLAKVEATHTRETI